MEKDKPLRCSKWVYDGHPHPCFRFSVVVRDGKPYCKQHDPVVVKARLDAHNKRWDEKWAAREKAEKHQDAIDSAELGVIRAARRWVNIRGNGDASGNLILAVKKLERLVKK